MAKKTSTIEKKEKYFEAVGRRKTAIARVRVYNKEIKNADLIVNNKPFNSYFPLEREHKTVVSPFVLVNHYFMTRVMVRGGGLNGQSEAVRLGIARALVLIKSEWRPKLKAAGFLKRDPRMVERKKYGSRKARRPQQWRKR